VTGATSGLGFQTALALARAGADVVVAGQDEARGRQAVAAIRPCASSALVRFERLDLASLASVADFAGRMTSVGRPIDLLINHACASPSMRRKITADGFELLFGLNYLGHFALTARLLPLLRRSRQPRVVHLSSASHRKGAIHFDDLQLLRRYKPRAAERQSALAALMFALELQRRSDTHGWGLVSVAAHPGVTTAARCEDGLEDGPRPSNRQRIVGALLKRPPAAGALPILFAATAPQAQAGGYYGPVGPLGLVGPLGDAAIGNHARDIAMAQMLWAVSEKLTGATWLAES
jgi:NAD(P)-dependent dehydrogenase (short-subunit alcohol dehydrogenase family)